VNKKTDWKSNIISGWPWDMVNCEFGCQIGTCSIVRRLFVYLTNVSVWRQSILQNTGSDLTGSPDKI